MTVHDYKVNAAGTITSPGKFEGEPSWVPYLWAQEDDVAFDDGSSVVFRAFRILPEDRKRYPALKGVFAAVLAETDDGFVTGHTFTTDYELGVFMSECELAQEGQA